MAKVQSHRDLIVWQKAMDLVEEIYGLAASFPSDERFRLVDQITRSAVSVPANIAEGHARSTRRDYASFIAIAKGSLMETETFVFVAMRLGYVSEDAAQQALNLIAELSKMLTSLRRRLLN